MSGLRYDLTLGRLAPMANGLINFRSTGEP